MEGEGEDEAEETEGLLVATGVDGDEAGAGEGDSPREPPAAAAAAPGAAVPTLLSTSVTAKQNHISIRARRRDVKVGRPYLPRLPANVTKIDALSAQQEAAVSIHTSVSAMFPKPPCGHTSNYRSFEFNDSNDSSHDLNAIEF